MEIGIKTSAMTLFLGVSPVKNIPGSELLVKGVFSSIPFFL